MEAETIAKAVGVVSGTFLSLVFVPPRTRRGFVRRTAAALMVGFIFGHSVLQVMIVYAGWLGGLEDITASRALAAFISWYAMGLISKFLKRKSEEM